MVFVPALGYAPMMTRAVGRQEQKSERARTTICEATIRCLAELGYAETSINRVVERAGVSKGALQYHFPSKEDLMASTAAFLLQRPLRHADAARQEDGNRGSIGSGGDIRRRMLDIWNRLISTSAYLALLEILVASRTDKVLHARIAAELEASIHEIDRHFLPLYGELEARDEEDLMLLMTANRCLMRGLLIEEQYGLDKRRQRQVLERWMDLVVPELERKVALADTIESNGGDSNP
jgi:AcrR family transcriptional regulator